MTYYRRKYKRGSVEVINNTASFVTYKPTDGLCLIISTKY